VEQEVSVVKAASPIVLVTALSQQIHDNGTPWNDLSPYESNGVVTIIIITVIKIVVVKIEVVIVIVVVVVVVVYQWL
jgi:hypothetical protein